MKLINTGLHPLIATTTDLLLTEHSATTASLETAQVSYFRGESRPPQI